MKNTKKALSLFIAFFVLGITLTAQPVMSLWSVDKEHLEDHTKGFSEEWPCGYEYYITYLGEKSSTVLIIDIANEGDQDLVLDAVPAFTVGSSSDFSIISPMENLTIPPGGSAHFGILYDAPASYISSAASLEIKSNDPNYGTCVVNFQVGIAGPPLLQLREGTDPLQPGLGAINFGSVQVGQTATKTLNIHNTSGNVAQVYGCSPKLVDIIIREMEEDGIERFRLVESIRNINFQEAPYQIPGPVIAFPIVPIALEPIGPPSIAVPIFGSFITGLDRLDFAADLPPSFIIQPGQSQDFTLSFTPSEEGEKDAAICFHYITGEFRRGGQNNYGIQATGILPSEDLPVLPKWAMIFLGSILLGLASYLISRQL